MSRKTTMTLITQELGKEGKLASSETAGKSGKEGLVIVTDFPPHPPPQDSDLQSGISSASAASHFSPPIDHYRQLPSIVKAASTAPAPAQAPTGDASPSGSRGEQLEKTKSGSITAQQAANVTGSDKGRNQRAAVTIHSLWRKLFSHCFMSPASVILPWAILQHTETRGDWLQAQVRGSLNS